MNSPKQDQQPVLNKNESQQPSKHQEETVAEAISPRTKLPVSHPESKAVEQIHYEMQQSLASAISPAEAETLLKEMEKKQK
ncbi:MAG TPA: hypothetical protein VFV96_05285 [Verrucomicrobiae bacterium]|nr:hypothetical protein [Verrucomicrobiae bacterium]